MLRKYVVALINASDCLLGNYGDLVIIEREQCHPIICEPIDDSDDRDEAERKLEHMKKIGTQAYCKEEILRLRNKKKGKSRQ